MIKNRPFIPWEIWAFLAVLLGLFGIADLGTSHYARGELFAAVAFGFLAFRAHLRDTKDSDWDQITKAMHERARKNRPNRPRRGRGNYNGWSEVMKRHLDDN
jgi:hypothetical protein